MAGAAHLGMRGLALTDHNNVYGAVRGFQKAAQALDIQPILGAELTIEPYSASLDDEAGGRLASRPYRPR